MVSYKPLFKLLIDRDLKKKDFRALTGISYGTLNKLERNENVMVDILDRICQTMDCTIDQIIEIIPDSEQSVTAESGSKQREA